MATIAAGELRVVNPATAGIVATVSATPAEAVAGLVADAGCAQQAWGTTALQERRELLLGVAELLLDRVDEIADALVAETAKPRGEAFATELYPAADAVVWTASNAPRVLAPERLHGLPAILRHKRAWLLYEPLGVVAAITPWNFPFSIPFSLAAFAVAAGNAVVVKPSELTPLSGAWVERLYAEAGAPAGLVSVAQGDGRVGDALVRSPGVGKVVFTGSADVGRVVAAAAGANLVPVTFVDRDRGRVRVPWWYPYVGRSLDGFRGVIRVLHRRGVGAKAAAAWRHRAGLGALARRYLR